LGNELTCEYFSRTGDNYWARFYFTRAYKCYCEWGAKEKVDQLVYKCGEYIEEPIQPRLCQNSTSMRLFVSGKDVVEIHKAINLDLLSGQNPNNRLGFPMPIKPFRSSRKQTYLN
jgi:hypothetical protein